MTKLPRIVLQKGKDGPIRGGHPWIFSGAVKKIDGNVENGSQVEVFSHDNSFLGTGFYAPTSIAIKMLSPTRGSAADLIRAHVTAAFDLRTRLGLTQNEETTAYRLVNGEGDFLPGLIIDVYCDTAVIQFHSAGMARSKEAIVDALRASFGTKLSGIYSKSTDTLEGESDGFLFGSSEPGIILENGNRFHVDWRSGQKTGFFLDQRENRALVQRYSKDKSILNTFCYTGGFSIYALKGGANHVVSVDASKPALRIAEQNGELNDVMGRHTVIEADCFKYLETVEPKFDIVILDPPAFAKHRSAVRSALGGYRGLNMLGLRALKPGGILFTFSCSQLVSRDDFFLTVRDAAQESGRSLQLLHSLHQAPCHPTSLFHPEGPYLKGFVFGVN